MKSFVFWLWLCLAGVIVSASAVEKILEATEQHKSAAFFAPPDSPDYRKYAPDRAINVVNLAIDVTPNFSNRTIAAKTTIKFKPIATELPELSLDAVDLRVTSVKSSEAILEYQVTDEKIIVTFAKPIPADKEAWVSAEYAAEPKQGLYFRTPEMGYKVGDTHLFTQGESIEARHWYPCPDAPNQKFTSEIICRLPEGMTAISNGRKISETKDAATRLVAHHWKQEKPHANYLVSLCAGYFKKIEDRYRDIPMAFYTPPSDINEAINSFRDTKDMMEFFEKEIGVPYPWGKYDQVVVNDFVAGGMENTSKTTLTDRTLFRSDTENLHSSEGLVAHELAHQWFGDLTTCKDWSHLWLNEGFATYYAHLYTAHKNGREKMLFDLYNDSKSVIARMGDVGKPIVDRKFNSPSDMFSFLAYDKGGWVLHMLRSQLGEELYRRCIKTWLERHGYGSVVTEDLNRVIEELSGKSYDQFFDQWVYHSGAPDLEVNYSWDARAKLARISVKQNQKVSDDVALFNFPLPIRFKTKSGTVDKTAAIKERSEDFYFPLDEAPSQVRIDPDLTVLARINFTPSSTMLETQRQDHGDMLGRLLAVEALGKRRDNDAVEKLKRSLNEDAFFGVRIEAAQALRTIHSDEALDALLASTKQSDARVRRQVLESIGGFYDGKVLAAQIKALRDEKNPGIQAEAIEQLGVYTTPEVREMLLKQLDAESYRNALADAAIRAMRAANDPAFIAPLLKNLEARETEYESRSFAAALTTLAALTRDDEAKRPEVREFLLSHLNSTRRTTRIGAINALGALEDPRTLAVLEKFTLASKNSREQTAATEAIKKITGARRADDGLAELRNKFLDLQKEAANLRKDFKAVEKKLEAVSTVESSGKKSKPALHSPRTKSN